MLALKEKIKRGAIRYGRFSISCSGIETRILPGDELIFLKTDTPPNILLNRKIGSGMTRMDILSDQGEDILRGTIFTKEQLELMIVVLAACFGLSFERKNPSAKKKKSSDVEHIKFL